MGLGWAKWWTELGKLLEWSDEEKREVFLSHEDVFGGFNESYGDIHTAMYDMMVQLRQYGRVDQLNDVHERVIQDIRSLLQAAPRAVLGFDNPDHVTAAKHETQADRIRNNKGDDEKAKEERIFTPEGDLDEYFANPESLVPDWTAFLNNRPLRTRLFESIVTAIVQRFPLQREQEILIVGLGTKPIRLTPDLNRIMVLHDDNTKADAVFYQCKKELVDELENCIGEFDISAAFLATYYAVTSATPHNTLFRTIDSDEVMIFLLQSEERYSQQLKRYIGNVFIEYTQKARSGETRNIISINDLARVVRTSMRRLFPRMPAKVLIGHFVVCAIMGGTDFFDGLPDIGGGIAFEAALKFLRNLDLQKREYSPFITYDRDPETVYDTMVAKYRESQDKFQVADLFMVPTTVSRNKLCALVCFTYMYKYDRPATRGTRLLYMPQLLPIMQRKAGSRFRGMMQRLATEAGALDAVVRRRWWTILYWRNGYKQRGLCQRYLIDPCHVDEEGVSFWGFGWNEKKRGQRVHRVTPASKAYYSITQQYYKINEAKVREFGSVPRDPNAGPPRKKARV